VEYISNDTYSNKYDLDEIDVFLEGDSSNPMFFSINGLPNQLSYGKHYFNISLLDSSNNDYFLRNESRIIFECKSVNNIVLKSDVVKLNQKNGVVVCSVEVLENPLRTYEEIKDGSGTLTVVGSLDSDVQTIPEKYKHAMNYRCIFPIQIGKNLLNADSPRVLQSQHKLETYLGRFSFVKASVSSPKHSNLGTKYDGSGNAASAWGGSNPGHAGGGS
jgi:hypothetical protein